MTAHLYVLPACRKLSGHRFPFSATVKAKLDLGGASIRLDLRPEYRRVVISWKSGESVAEATVTSGHQMSSR